VLAALLIVLVSAPFKQMLQNSSASKKVTRMQSTSRDVLAMMSREIRNTGLKRYSFFVSDTFNSAIIPKTYLATDSSSFTLKQGNPGDTLIIYKATIDDGGFSTGGVDSVKFFLKNDTLIRNFNGTEIVLADNIFALQFKTGLLAKDSLLFKADTFVLTKWNGSGVNSNLSLDNNDLSIACSGAGSGTVTSVNTFSVNPAARIKVNFSITNKTGIPGNVTSLKWSVLNSSNTVVASEAFKPGLTSASLVIPVPSVISNGKIQIQTVCTGAATFVLNTLEIRTVDRGAICWSDTVAVKEKRNVKAIKLFVLQRSSGKADMQKNSPVNVANVTINRPGAYSWRLLSETVEILNNGIF
jgi:hypothetical protein